jgi:hypothetical protein
MLRFTPGRKLGEGMSRRLAMSRLNMDERCEALFASELQRSDVPTPEEVAEVISRTVGRMGIAGCIGKMAQEFGDHPEVAAERMRWARQLAVESFAARGERPGAGAAVRQRARARVPACRPAAGFAWRAA